VNYLEQDNEDFMLTEGIMKAWDSVNWDRCGWYLDCPLNKPPSFDIALRDSLEPSLIGTGTQKETSTPDKEAASTQKATTTSKRGSKRKANVVETTAALAAVPVTSQLDKTAAPQSAMIQPPISETPASSSLEPTAKRVKLSTHATTTPVVFISPPKRGSMMAKPGIISSNHTSLHLLVNDSFVRMADEKKETGKFCSQYDEIVQFLSKVVTSYIFLVFFLIFLRFFFIL
jgi:hypothetical protein